MSNDEPQLQLSNDQLWQLAHRTYTHYRKPPPKFPESGAPTGGLQMRRVEWLKRAMQKALQELGYIP